MCMKVAPLAVALAAVSLTGTARRAASDDWRQFRRDERRTAASLDRLQLPLTDIWTVPGEGTVTWRGRAFYVGPSGQHAAVFCSDLRTGSVLWVQPLSYPWRSNGLVSVGLRPDRRGPVAVTADGIVYVQDVISGTASAGGVSSQGVTVSFGRSTQHLFRAFRATDGVSLGLVSSSPNDPPIPQAILFDGPDAPLRQPVNRNLPSLGPSLILGNEVVAGGIGDALFRWTLGSSAGLLAIAHAVPRPGSEAELLTANLGGFPPASAGSGLVIGGMSGPEASPFQNTAAGKQLLAVMNGGNCLWHRDYPWSLGFPTVEKDCILTGAGGIGANHWIMAHHMTTGAVKWVYPPKSLRPDGIGQASGAAVYTGPGGSRASMGSTSYPFANRHGYRANAGIAVAQGRAYGVVFGEVVALDVNRGTPLWVWPAPVGEIARSVVLSPGHVIVSLDRTTSKTPMARLVALRLADGKPEWSQLVPSAGDLTLSDGLLFLSDGAVHAFAPAERTYRMAVDSPHPEDYDPLPGLNQEPVTEKPDSETKDEEAKPAVVTRRKGVADASVVRLYWGDPLEKMLKQVRERQTVAPGLPLLLSLDWLDPTRTTIRGGQTGWSAGDTAAFAALCERLVQEAAPQHFDLAPEVDVYLSRDLKRLSAVRALLQAAVKAVKKASPATKVLISLNREVLARRYGRGAYAPFGKVAFLNREEQGQLLSLLDEVDEIGLTSVPQSAFRSPVEIPGDYLLGLQGVLPPKKPILLTRLAVQWDDTDKRTEVTQASYLKHLIQTAYWINAEWVAYPELLGAKRGAGDRSADLALRVDQQDRIALLYWRDTLRWKRVSRLTAIAADFNSQLR